MASQRSVPSSGAVANTLARTSRIFEATADASGLPVHSFALEGSVVGNLANQLIALRAVEDLATFRQLYARSLTQTIYPPAGR